VIAGCSDQRQRGHHRAERQQRTDRDHDPANAGWKARREQQLGHAADATSPAIT
jgi:hypothetical protein